MQPIFKMTADGKDVTEVIRRHVISIEVSDERDFTSDTLCISLDDSEGKIAPPRKGVLLNFWLGYKETGLVFQGGFTVDEVKMSGSPDRITVIARGANLRQELRSPKSRSFHECTIGELVTKIAVENGMIPKVNPLLAIIKTGHIDQTNESDIHLLQRISLEHDALVKFNDNYLVFTPNAQSKTTSGKILSTVTINKNICPLYNATNAERSIYNSVTTSWRDRENAITKEVTAGVGGPQHRIRTPYPNEQRAYHAAAAKLAQFQRSQGKVVFGPFTGNPEIYAESPIDAVGYRDGVSGSWVAKKVMKRFRSDGTITCTVECEPPQ